MDLILSFSTKKSKSMNTPKILKFRKKFVAKEYKFSKIITFVPFLCIYIILQRIKLRRQNQLQSLHRSFLLIIFFFSTRKRRNQNLRIHQRFLNLKQNSQQKSIQIFQNYYICTLCTRRIKLGRWWTESISSSIFSFIILSFSTKKSILKSPKFRKKFAANFSKLLYLYYLCALTLFFIIIKLERWYSVTIFSLIFSFSTKKSIPKIPKFRRKFSTKQYANFSKLLYLYHLCVLTLFFIE